jgi:hypothetical protein
MEIQHAGYDLRYMAILFIVRDADVQWVCAVLPDALGAGFHANEAELLSLFNARRAEITDSAAHTISAAKRQGVVHRVGEYNKPLFVDLPAPLE